MSRQLFTVGYEGNTIDSFIAHLQNNNIKYLVDVRQVPFSRKQGFSKTKLARTLNRAKIHYVHLVDLGAPKSLRENLKSTGDYSAFFKKMDRYLSGKKEAIEEAYHYVISSRCCLMCFEHLAAQCHRRIVARKIKARDEDGLQIKHI